MRILPNVAASLAATQAIGSASSVASEAERVQEATPLRDDVHPRAARYQRRLERIGTKLALDMLRNPATSWPRHIRMKFFGQTDQGVHMTGSKKQVRNWQLINYTVRSDDASPYGYWPHFGKKQARKARFASADLAPRVSTIF